VRHHRWGTGTGTAARPQGVVAAHLGVVGDPQAVTVEGPRALLAGQRPVLMPAGHRWSTRRPWRAVAPVAADPLQRVHQRGAGRQGEPDHAGQVDGDQRTGRHCHRAAERGAERSALLALPVGRRQRPTADHPAGVVGLGAERGRLAGLQASQWRWHRHPQPAGGEACRRVAEAGAVPVHRPLLAWSAVMARQRARRRVPEAAARWGVWGPRASRQDAAAPLEWVAWASV
jgi:hypothetical protein